MSSPVKLSYGTLVSGTGGVTSLASSSTWTAGYEWYVIDNTSELALERGQQGQITVGTSPTNNTEIRLYAIASEDGTTWPDVFDGTPSAETVTSEGVRDGFAKLVATLRVDSTNSNRSYPFSFQLGSFFSGALPKKVAIFVAHNTGVALNSTAGNHTYADQPKATTVG